MKITKVVVALALSLIGAVSAQCQTRILTGISGGSAFSNFNLGVNVATEIPLNHFEVDLSETYSPIETHTALGKGTANVVRAGGISWLGKVGLTGSTEYSTYSVTGASKGADYAFAGVVLRKNFLGTPTRFYFRYLRQFNNGVSKTGLETSHLNGGDFELSGRLGCSGMVCYRLTEEITFGRVLEQGDPACDGSIGPKTCGSRTATFGAGFSASFRFEFKRPSHPEEDLF